MILPVYYGYCNLAIKFVVFFLLQRGEDPSHLWTDIMASWFMFNAVMDYYSLENVLFWAQNSN